MTTALDRPREAIAAGAQDVLTKPFEVNDLLSSVQQTLKRTKTWRRRLEGMPPLPPTERADLKTFVEEISLRGSLTLREREVLEQVLLGKTNADAATALGLTVRTVKYHLTLIMRKVGVASRYELMSLVFH